MIVSKEAYDAFVALLNEPPKANPKLRALFDKYRDVLSPELRTQTEGWRWMFRGVGCIE